MKHQHVKIGDIERVTKKSAMVVKSIQGCSSKYKGVQVNTKVDKRHGHHGQAPPRARPQASRETHAKYLSAALARKHGVVVPGVTGAPPRPPYRLGLAMVPAGASGGHLPPEQQQLQQDVHRWAGAGPVWVGAAGAAHRLGLHACLPLLTAAALGGHDCIAPLPLLCAHTCARLGARTIPECSQAPLLSSRPMRPSNCVVEPF